MHKPERDLTGIRFVYGAEEVLPEFLGTDIEPGYRASLESKQRVIDNARERGGVMLESDEPMPPSDTPTYRLNNPGWRDPAVTRRLLERLVETSDMGPVPPVKALGVQAAFNDPAGVAQLHRQIEDGQSFVLAFTAAQRGHGKYLIERSSQLEKVQAALDAPEMWDQAARWLELRPFIPTPTDRYTSYRIVASPVGALLAAGLLYSGHTEGEGRIIQNDRFDDAVAEARGLKSCFEDPKSPYFLESRDIRSNVAAGGGFMPLMGSPDQRRPISPLEQEILAEHQLADIEAHGNVLAYSAAHIGRLCGPQLDICIGIDYVEDARARAHRHAVQDTARHQSTASMPAAMLEINVGPASTTYNSCHLRGEASPYEATYLMRQAALDSVGVAYAR